MVQKKIKVGFIIASNSNWLGEFNYFKSLIGSINDLNEETRIELYLFTSRNEKFFTKKNFNRINIVKTKFLNPNGVLHYIKRISSYFFGKYDPILIFLLKRYSINILSHYKPLFGFKNISWLPDFQHIHYPNFFSRKELSYRDKLYNNYIKNSDSLVVSSKSSKKDLIKFGSLKKKINILNFVPRMNFSIIKNKNFLNKEIDIKKRYIFIPNQFWIHKNHICIIEALKILKNKGLNIQCILTGSKIDHRKPNHFKNLMKKIKKYDLIKEIKYRGILPYEKIINLLYHAEVIINPSYFEGWSTVVEEAKILDKKILLSNIEVHHEQNPKNGLYFNPDNPKELANSIINSFKGKKKMKDINKLIKIYEHKKILFAKKYIDIVMRLYN